MEANSHKIRVALAEDHPISIKGMEMLLEREPAIRIIHTAKDGATLLRKIRQEVPDVVVTDIGMPEMDGLALTKALHQSYPAIGVIALTMFEDPGLIVAMLEAGARGYLLKGSCPEDLVKSIYAVAMGRTYFCSHTSILLSKRLAASEIDPFEQGVTFSEKEIEIIRLICSQYSSKQIGMELKVSERTVDNHRYRLLKKTGAQNVAGLVVYAIKHGLFKP